ncbi:hypothetical protein [Parasphaerochaeta coccoides]|uniref:Uncharacterized protein n=1 Tax=Parasphaerochaeta coccoides (strain ATCC BAA-1237 / DSM 17374 / SPN1) TaxID=760011 RepID=F4GK05_PARC1|nr:hypothetical protein [Parasphaerochaeta coccoides]AEC01777.1 hypothetical protein Spico_0549 [Parasphaerochaeta coccoides DSM 17374]
MLKLRRILAISSQLHTYLLIADVTVFCMRFILPSWDAELQIIQAFRTYNAILGWTGILFGIFIICGSILAYARDEVNIAHLLVPAIIKTVIFFAVSFLSGLINSIVQGGVIIV